MHSRGPCVPAGTRHLTSCRADRPRFCRRSYSPRHSAVTREMSAGANRRVRALDQPGGASLKTPIEMTRSAFSALGVRPLTAARSPELNRIPSLSPAAPAVPTLRPRNLDRSDAGRFAPGRNHVARHGHPSGQHQILPPWQGASQVRSPRPAPEAPEHQLAKSCSVDRRYRQAYRSPREVLAGSTPASTRRLIPPSPTFQHRSCPLIERQHTRAHLSFRTSGAHR